VLRFSSFVDIMRIFVSLTVSYALLMITSVLTESYLEFNLAPVSVLFMSYIISFAMMACSRVIVKTFFEALNFDGTHSANVFIYGAKEAGVNIAKALRVNLRNHYRLRGFIADEPELINKVMMGVKVFPNDDTLIDVLNDRDVQTIIISPAKMEELKKSDMADRLLVHITISYLIKGSAEHYAERLMKYNGYVSMLKITGLTYKYNGNISTSKFRNNELRKNLPYMS
jgi:FlaA1/EpsC-like NDP-sugar epimerase